MKTLKEIREEAMGRMSVDSVEEEDRFKSSWGGPTYRHRTIRRYKLGEHEFSDNLYTPQSAELNEDFLRMLGDLAKLSPADVIDIVEYDAAAAARVEKPVASRTVRGTAESTDVAGSKRQTDEASKPSLGGFLGGKPAVDAAGTGKTGEAGQSGNGSAA